MSKLPKWFEGELYEEGATVKNRFSGEEYELNAMELSMYDFVIGATIVAEMGMFNESQDVKDLKKGLEWFRKNNNKANMTLFY